MKVSVGTFVPDCRMIAIERIVHDIDPLPPAVGLVQLVSRPPRS